LGSSSVFGQDDQGAVGEVAKEEPEDVAVPEAAPVPEPEPVVEEPVPEPQPVPDTVPAPVPDPVSEEEEIPESAAEEKETDRDPKETALTQAWNQIKEMELRKVAAGVVGAWGIAVGIGWAVNRGAGDD